MAFVMSMFPEGAIIRIMIKVNQKNLDGIEEVSNIINITAL